MVSPGPGIRGQRAFLATEMVVALGLLVVVALPLAYAHVGSLRRVAADYQRTVVLELVDGEAEILAAGAAAAVAEGRQDWTLQAASVRNVPAGKFTLTREGRRFRLEWNPADRRQGRPVVREFTLREPVQTRTQP
ncbi:MAG: hypothetical protein J0L84_06035 [Verrucomicrobia bacterium]|nr:hypothetical protein [Verrucomicrobiota bacterium]